MPSKTIVAIIAVTIIISLCIWRNIDGALVGVGVAAIAGLGGYAVGTRKKS
ncbi:unnamed protein product [marine sediment metagenome]|uniref:Uncharacterized protein n=1 Tax=marine sediment metagenome TaxID=412755 RepID=X1HBS8_9ZZZZ